MVTTVLITLMILALLEIVLLNGARLFFMIASAVQQAQDDKYTPHPHPKSKLSFMEMPYFNHCMLSKRHNSGFHAVLAHIGRAPDF